MEKKAPEAEWAEAQRACGERYDKREQRGMSAAEGGGAVEAEERRCHKSTNPVTGAEKLSQPLTLAQFKAFCGDDWVERWNAATGQMENLPEPAGAPNGGAGTGDQAWRRQLLREHEMQNGAGAGGSRGGGRGRGGSPTHLGGGWGRGRGAAPAGRWVDKGMHAEAERSRLT